MIRIFSETFEFITEIDAIESVMWTKRWHKQGEFQIVVNQHMENVDELLEGRIINNGPDKTGVIAHIEETTSESGKGSDQLLIRGYDLKGLIAKRFTIPPIGQAYDAQTTNAETLMKRFVNNNAISTTPERIIPNLSIAPNLNRGSSFFYQTRFKNLAEELEKLSVSSGLGWDVLFNGNSYIFDVLEGKDLTSIQNINPPVIFSAEFDNVKSQKVIESALDYKNAAIVAGQGEGAEREVVFIGKATGLARNEVYIDARDIEEGGNLLDRGEQKLAEYARVESFETSVLTYGPFVYGQDWNLGDIVTVQNAKKTRTAHLRVTEVSEVIEKDGYQLDAIFGQPMPTIIEKIKRELDEPVAEGGTVGETGAPGTDGVDGVGLDYVWNGTSLGVKRDDDTNFQYANLIGPRGLQGPQGLKGDAGPVGPQGIQGPIGATGPQGLKGDKGLTGDAGPQGPIGLTGAKGETGAQGPIGATGARGLQGIQGVQGPKGDKGDTGLPGPQGIQGLKGDTGDQGEMGPPGSSQSYVLFEKEFISTEDQALFSWTDGVNYPVGIRAVNLFVNGERQPQTAFTEHANGKGITLKQGLTDGQYILVSAQMAVVDIQGPKGEKGDTGDTGPIGPIGPQGIQGVKGNAGSTGATGPTGPMGPQGLKGDTGSQGAQGIQGPQGVTGQDGKTWHSSTAIPATSLGGVGDFHLNTSTWDIREKTGASVWTVRGNIKGAVGATGAQGPQGIQGVKGDTGAVGAQGPIGLTGAQGIQGIKGDKGDKGDVGATGPQGIQGLKGDTGSTGAQGIQGPIGLTGPEGPQGPKGDKGEPGAAVADSVEWVKVLNKPDNLETTDGARTKIDDYKPYHAGTIAPTNKNLIWIDTN